MDDTEEPGLDWLDDGPPTPKLESFRDFNFSSEDPSRAKPPSLDLCQLDNLKLKPASLVATVPSSPQTTPVGKESKLKLNDIEERESIYVSAASTPGSQVPPLTSCHPAMFDSCDFEILVGHRIRSDSKKHSAKCKHRIKSDSKRHSAKCKLYKPAAYIY